MALILVGGACFWGLGFSFRRVSLKRVEFPRHGLKAQSLTLDVAASMLPHPDKVAKGERKYFSCSYG